MVQIHHPIRSRSPLAYCPFLIFLSFSKHHHPQLRSLAPSYLVLVHSAKPSCFQWHSCILFSSDWTTHLFALWFILSHCVKSLHRCSRSLSDPERRLVSLGCCHTASTRNWAQPPLEAFWSKQASSTRSKSNAGVHDALSLLVSGLRWT